MNCCHRDATAPNDNPARSVTSVHRLSGLYGQRAKSDSPRMDSTHQIPRKLAILGATGSIGRNTVDVVDHLSDQIPFEITAVSGHSNVDLLARQAIALDAGFVVTSDPDCYSRLKDNLSGTGIECAAGHEALTEAARRGADIVMAAIVGIAGLAPTLAAATDGADIALANKECLVSAGSLLKGTIRQAGGRLLPVDSEHNAIDQCIAAGGRNAVERIILTASGGPFRDYSLDEMAGVTPQTAAAHPNWSMGLKISIDSASMFNKALEMIEAQHLFDLEPDQVEVVVHPQSIVHSMVGYSDGSILAQLGCPDMRTAIGYALSWPNRPALPVERLDFTQLSRLDFHPPDETRFPALRLARLAMEADGLAGAVLNGAKERALDAFIDSEIAFLDMAVIVERTMERLGSIGPATSIEAVYDADAQARRVAGEEIARCRSAA